MIAYRTSPTNAANIVRRIAEQYGLKPEILENLSTPPEVETVQSPDDAAAILLPKLATYKDREVFVIMVLNTRNEVLSVIERYHGSLNSSMIRTGECFKEAIAKDGACVILAHNHPSGDPSPSPEDVAVTRAFVQAGELLDIPVLDHIVIGNGRYVSLKARGLGFDR